MGRKPTWDSVNCSESLLSNFYGMALAVMNAFTVLKHLLPFVNILSFVSTQSGSAFQLRNLPLSAQTIRYVTSVGFAADISISSMISPSVALAVPSSISQAGREPLKWDHNCDRMIFNETITQGTVTGA
ncbi:hypothetical protein AAFF_G00323020 [Aldrovandia affinis]|uniref:Uncharacterized protein n=1 Tax=Aldrovandia affinis TaxID=143900 RepID=A0AAD7WQ51_9TELE|nr:hypothetical protein AAFF_G00323020 [Aldrovandia affinis]